MNETDFDVIIIGAGMSGLAAGIRLAMYDKKVCILEKHSISGGLNSYYQRGKRQFDVGLHALTNFRPKGEKKGPLPKLLKQLRIPYDDFNLCPQIKSQIIFPDESLSFSNDLNLLIQEIHQKFPKEIDNFNKLLSFVENFNELDIEDNKFISSKEVVATFIKNPLLINMIFCPLLIYGSAWVNDMDLSQFVIMFKALFLEGFSRPYGGVRTIINLLETKFRENNGQIKFKSEVKKLIINKGQIEGVELSDNTILKAKKVFSSIGLPETFSLTKEEQTYPKGELSFTECIGVYKNKPKDFGIDSTIVFYSKNSNFHYGPSKGLYDLNSGVICLPNNFSKDDQEEGIIRFTNMANFNEWNLLDKKEYLINKHKLFDENQNHFKTLYPQFNSELLFKDIFTPKTVLRYTGHYNGAVYGAPLKIKNGITPVKDLFICGTDQGFLGVIGAMLSGISMANLHGLMGE